MRDASTGEPQPIASTTGSENPSARDAATVATAWW
jgi:hypothetical protein